MCERLCKPVRAAQIARSGSVTTTTVATQVADQLGGYGTPGRPRLTASCDRL